ncbi:MAG: matrixin family metalloprotease [Proteobacteria bacterium]|nr:matrixin family metalloprotease [Pseudomonadota bacterium]
MTPAFAVAVAVLSQQPQWSHDQPWSIETSVVLQTDTGRLIEVVVPGGTIGETSVRVSHTPELVTGGVYKADFLHGTSTRHLLEAVPVSVPPSPRYAVSGSAWSGDAVEVPFYLNTDTWPSEFAANDLEKAFTDALDVWNVYGQAKVHLDYGGRTTNTQYGSGSDGSNTTKWQSFHLGSTLAISVQTTSSGNLVDCDIRFYGSNTNGSIEWNVNPNGAPDGENAVRHTLVHEFGHCIGISHSAIEAALMYRYAPDDQGPESWVLHDDDVDAVQSIYGVANPALGVTGSVANGELTLAVANSGDWTAFEVEVDAVLTGDVSYPGLPVGLGDILDGASEQATLTLDGCGATTASIVLTDAAGSAWNTDLPFDVPCENGPADSGDPNTGDTGTTSGDEPGGCACNSSTPTSGFLVFAALPLLLRRRR